MPSETPVGTEPTRAAGPPSMGAAGPEDAGRRPPGPTPGPAGRRTDPGGRALGVVLVVAGAAWLLASSGVDVPVAVVTPMALVVLGAIVIVGAVRGSERPAIGLAVVVGVWLSLAALVTAVVDVPLTGGVGDREVSPATVAELGDGHRLFAGTQRVDLRDLVLEDGTAAVELTTVLGEVEVVVPGDMAVRVDAAVAAGSIDLDGAVVDGVGLSQTERSESWSTADRRIDLELRVALGEVRVRSE